MLREIWDSFDARKLYDEENSFESLDFSALRWQLALMIEELLKYPPDKKGSKESAFSFPAGQEPAKNSLDCSKGAYIMSEIRNTKWKSLAEECSVSMIFDKARNKEIMLFKVTVDHNKDGESPNGAYPLGWPRCSLNLQNPLDFSKYEGMLFYIKFCSNRDEVADDYTYLAFECKDNSNKKIFSDEILGASPENEWITTMLPFSDTQAASGGLKNVCSMNIIVPESYYPDKTEISFFIDGPYLYSIKDAFLEKVRHPHFILKEETTELPIEIDAKGITSSKSLTLKLDIIDESGKTIHSESLLIDKADFEYHLPLRDFIPGKYTVKIFKQEELQYSSYFNLFSK